MMVNDCTPGMGRIAGGWHDLASAMVGMPLVREALRRAVEGGK